MAYVLHSKDVEALPLIIVWGARFPIMAGPDQCVDEVRHARTRARLIWIAAVRPETG